MTGSDNSTQAKLSNLTLDNNTAQVKLSGLTGSDTTQAQSSSILYELGWAGLHLGASAALVYGSNTGTKAFDVLKKAGINTGTYELKNLLSYYLSHAPTTEGPSIWSSITDISLDITLSVVQAGVIAAITGATLGAGTLLIPALMAGTNSLITHYNMYNSNGASSSYVGKVLPYVTGAYSAYSLFTKVPVVTGDALSHSLQTIQKGFGAVASFVGVHQFTSLVADAVDPYISKMEAKVGEWCHGAYDYASSLFGGHEVAHHGGEV
ncbi:hypothetical protein MIDIC_410027 [Alphaproteobacteria bacterium]